jgi:hypothetical protein
MWGVCGYDRERPVDLVASETDFEQSEPEDQPFNGGDPVRATTPDYL